MSSSEPEFIDTPLTQITSTATTLTLAQAAVLQRPSAWMQLLRNRKARLGGLLIVVMIVISLAAPLITPESPVDQNVLAKFAKPAVTFGGSWAHPLGTDSLGRDILSRILYGGRNSLLIGLIATVLASLVGVALGLISGYFGGVNDTVIMRLVDVQMAFPAILLALAVMVMLGPNLRNLILVLALTSWVFFSRVIRADVLTIKYRDFVEAGRSIGASNSRLILRYIMPNLVGTITVVATLTVARTIIAEASLSFLGLGIQPPTPSWGTMLAEGRRYIMLAWWIATFPGIALMATVIGVNLLGDALRDVLDPRIGSAPD